METFKNLQAIAAFEKVSSLQSFSLAAKELGVSKAHISKLIQKLEDTLGQRLLNRSTRTVKMTHAGEKFYNSCKVSLFNISKAQEEILQNSESPHGKIKISLAGAFAENYMVPFIANFIKRYPRVQVDLRFEEKVVDLVKESYDIAIRVGELKDSSLIAKQIATRKEYICATPSFLKHFGLPKSPEELKNFNCLTSKDHWNLVFNKKKLQLKVNSNFKSNSGKSILNAALTDLGICMLPKVYVGSYLENGQLISLLEEFTPEEIPIWAITPSKKNMAPNVKTFFDELTNQFNHIIV